MRGVLVAVRLTRSLPAELTQLRGSSTGTPISSSFGIAVRSTKRTSSSPSSSVVGSTGSKARPPSARTGSISPSWRCTAIRGIGRAEEAEHRVAAVVQERGGEGQRRIVGRLQPQLEHDGGRAAGLALARVALVEPEAEQPRCAGAALEAAVDPVGEPPLERAEPRVRRQLGLGRGEAVEEQLGCARPVAHEPVAEPHARRAEAVAGDLVDGAGVEVVHERVAVAVERVGADGRQRGRDRVERLLHRLVDRGAPVGEPRAPAVLELRVEEALGDGSRGELEHGEGRARGAAELEPGGRLLARGRSAPRGRPGGRSRRARAPPDPRPRGSRPAARRPRASRRGRVRARSR